MDTANNPRKATRVEVYIAVVDTFVAVVLLATMIGVFWYANDAAKAVKQQILDSRPVLMANMSEVWEEENKLPKTVNPRVVNFGKTVAKDVIPIGYIVVRSAGEPTPHHPNCNYGVPPPKDSWRTSAGAGQVVNRGWHVAQGEDITEANQGKIIYVVGCVYYEDLGDAPFYTDICMTWTPTGGLLACDDTSRNYVK